MDCRVELTRRINYELENESYEPLQGKIDYMFNN